MLKKSAWILILVIIPALLVAAPKEIVKIKFRNVEFRGDEKLKHIIRSEKGEHFDARLVKLDKILLTNYYKKNGFLDVIVRDSISIQKKKNEVSLYYFIDEGQRYYYGGVRFRGNYDLATRKLVELFDEIKLYTAFDEEKIALSTKKLENLYYNSGKPFVDIKVNYLYEQDSLIVVFFDVKENKTVYIKEMRFDGLKFVKKYVVRRELELKKGDIYNRKKLDLTQRNLYGTGLFKLVRMEIEPLTSQPDQARLVIRFQEKDPAWIGVRFGVAHEQEYYYGNKLELTLQGGHRNLFGSGRSFSLRVTPSLNYDFTERRFHNPDNKVGLEFIQPWIFNSPTPVALRLLYEQFRPLNSGHFDLWHVNLDMKRKLHTINEFSASLSGKLVNILSGQTVDSTLATDYQVDKSKVYALTFYYKRDTRKNIFAPKSSAYTDVSSAFSYAETRDKNNNITRNNYISLNASWQRYQPFRPQVLDFRRWKFTLATRIKAGAIIEPWGSKTIPISDRFFAGGATTVRGYGEQLLGPAALLDKNGNIKQAAGGKLIYLMNGEVRIPLFWLFIMEYFIDGGYVWQEISDFKFTDIRFSTGVGLALLTPLGPVRVDYGYKLMRKAIDPTADSFHIGIYFAF